jgi:hypothetical protein
MRTRRRREEVISKKKKIIQFLVSKGFLFFHRCQIGDKRDGNSTAGPSNFLSWRLVVTIIIIADKLSAPP